MSERPSPPVPAAGDRSWRAQRRGETYDDFRLRVEAQKALLYAAARPRIVKGQPVRLLYDQTFAFQRRANMTGRIGVIARVPGLPSPITCTSASIP